MKDLGLKEPFSGIVDIQSGEIGDDFSYYFAIFNYTQIKNYKKSVQSGDQNEQK